MSRFPVFTYSIINDLIVAKRPMLRLGAPIHMQFAQEWEQDNPLFDRYTLRSSYLPDSKQPHKEHQSPFFHEYVVFSLRDAGGCFRIDRRLKPDEKTPLNSIYAGVEAYDTTEEVASLDATRYGTPDRLIEMKFEANVELKFVLIGLGTIQGEDG